MKSSYLKPPQKSSWVRQVYNSPIKAVKVKRSETHSAKNDPTLGALLFSTNAILCYEKGIFINNKRITFSDIAGVEYYQDPFEIMGITVFVSGYFKIVPYGEDSIDVRFSGSQSTANRFERIIRRIREQKPDVKLYVD